MARPHGKISGLVPYDFRTPSLQQARRTFWNPDDERFLVPTFFGVGWTVTMRSASRHPFQAGLLAALIACRAYARKGR